MTGKKLYPDKFCKTLEHADSFWQRARGLMFRSPDSMPEGHGMLFAFSSEARHGIWTLFMRFPIDIYFLDRDMKVVGFVKGAKPFNPMKPSTWRIYYPKKKARYVLEMRKTV